MATLQDVAIGCRLPQRLVVLSREVRVWGFVCRLEPRRDTIGSATISGPGMRGRVRGLAGPLRSLVSSEGAWLGGDLSWMRGGGGDPVQASSLDTDEGHPPGTASEISVGRHIPNPCKWPARFPGATPEVGARLRCHTASPTDQSLHLVSANLPAGKTDEFSPSDLTFFVSEMQIIIGPSHRVLVRRKGAHAVGFFHTSILNQDLLLPPTPPLS